MAVCSLTTSSERQTVFGRPFERTDCRLDDCVGVEPQGEPLERLEAIFPGER